jgi:hypothetical protein
MYPNRRFSFNACVPSALSMEAMGFLHHVITCLPSYTALQTIRLGTSSHKPVPPSPILTMFNTNNLMLSFALVSGSVIFYRKLQLPFIAVSILRSRLMESYILFSAQVMVTPVTVLHTCEQSHMPLFLQFTTCGHPCYNPPYL